MYADLIAMLTLRPSIETYITLFHRLYAGMESAPLLFIPRVRVVLRVLLEEGWADQYRIEWDVLCKQAGIEADSLSIFTEEDAIFLQVVNRSAVTLQNTRASRISKEESGGADNMYTLTT